MGQAFEVDRGMISQAGVDALFVVEAIDVAGNGGVELGIAREAAAVSELGLQGMEEAFHMSVVLAVARAVHAGDDAVGLEIVLVAVGRVLDATIGVEEQSGLGSASRDRALERPQGYLSGAVASERPAHDAPREQIHHRGQVAPALAQTDRKSTRLNSSHTVIYTLSLHDALPISARLPQWCGCERASSPRCAARTDPSPWPGSASACPDRSEEHTSELQSHSDLHSFPTRRSSDLRKVTSVVRLRASVQPTMRRENRSITVAR